MQAALEALKFSAKRWGGNITFFTEFKFLVETWRQIREAGSIPAQTMCRQYWTEILASNARDIKLVLVRDAPFSRDVLRRLRTEGNDRCFQAIQAKQPIAASTLASWRMHINLQREWLCRLSVLLQEQKPDEPAGGDNERAVELNPDLATSYRQRFPRWDWFQSQSEYQWKIATDLAKPSWWKHGDAMWKVSADFWQGLQWRCGPSATTSITC
eukprot:Skav214759  [mRNA]  locus=scaffold1230:91595:92233:- [translate_table: standard]